MNQTNSRAKHRPPDLLDYMLARKMRTDRDSFARERRIKRTMWGAARERALKCEQAIRRLALANIDVLFTVRGIISRVSQSMPPYDTVQALKYVLHDCERFTEMMKKLSAEDAVRARRVLEKSARNIEYLLEQEQKCTAADRAWWLQNGDDRPSFLDSRLSKRARAELARCQP